LFSVSNDQFGAESGTTGACDFSNRHLDTDEATAGHATAFRASHRPVCWRSGAANCNAAQPFRPAWHFVISFTNRRHRQRTNAYISSRFSSARDNKRPSAANRFGPMWQH